MLSRLDIHRAAHVMMHEFGTNAEREAVLCANRMLQRGQPDAVLHWFQIWRTITLLRQTPADLPN